MGGKHRLRSVEHLSVLDTADSVIAGEMVVVSESFTKVQQSYYILAEKLLDRPTAIRCSVI